MNTDPMPIVVKKSPRSHHKFGTYVIKLADCLNGNTNFTNVSPSSATLKSLGDALILANAKAKHGGPAAVADRDGKRQELEHQLDVLVMNVQITVRAQADNAIDATKMILSTGLSIQKTATRSTDKIAVRHGDNSGEALLIARSLGRPAVYLWEYSLDQKTWSSVPESLKTRTSVAGLVPGQTYYFRFRAHTPKATYDYSDVVKLIVV